MCSCGSVFVQRREDPDRELRVAAVLYQLEQAMQVVSAVAGETRGEQRREAGVFQLPTAPSECAHI
jgi:hypothetical protein